MILLLSIPVWLYRNRIKLHLHSEHLYRCHQHAYSHKSGRYHVKRPWHRDRPLIHKFIIVRWDQRGLSSDDLREAVSFSSVKALTTNFLYYVYTNRAPWWGSIALLCVYPCNIKSYEFHKKKISHKLYCGENTILIFKVPEYLSWCEFKFRYMRREKIKNDAVKSNFISHQLTT